MVDYNRSTKTSSGQTAMIDGVPVPAADYELDQAAIATAFGNCAPSSGIDAGAVDDYSASATEQKTATSPGTGGSLSAPTTLEGEIERLRYAIERHVLGIDAKRYDGSSNVDTAWLDIPARPGNLIVNGCFLVKTTSAGSAPDGWTLTGTPSTCTTVTTGLTAEASGRAIHLVADAANEGITQTVKGLKAGGRYLVACRMAVASGTGRLVVTGADAASQFRAITQTSTASSYTTLKSVIQVDSTPTDIVVQVDAAANTDDITVTHVGVFACDAEVVSRPGIPPVYASDVSGTTTFTTATTLHTCAVYIPTTGYAIEVSAHCSAYPSTTDSYTATIKENTVAKNNGQEGAATNNQGTTAAFYAIVNPDPGLYTYTLEAARSGAATWTVTGSSLLVRAYPVSL